MAILLWLMMPGSELKNKKSLGPIEKDPGLKALVERIERKSYFNLKVTVTVKMTPLGLPLMTIGS
jgi:hypothetical protein